MGLQEGKTMIRAVIFDMFETLITHYNSPLYFGKQMAEDAGIPENRFLITLAADGRRSYVRKGYLGGSIGNDPPRKSLLLRNAFEENGRKAYRGKGRVL